MKAKLIIAAIVCAVAAFAVHRYVLSGPRSPILGFNSARQRIYDGIEIGDSLDVVRERLGEPVKSGSHLLLPQRAGFEDEFRQSEATASEIYYLWTNGNNWFYSVGVDSVGKVTFKAQGNS